MIKLFSNFWKLYIVTDFTNLVKFYVRSKSCDDDCREQEQLRRRESRKGEMEGILYLSMFYYDQGVS